MALRPRGCFSESMLFGYYLFNSAERGLGCDNAACGRLPLVIAIPGLCHDHADQDWLGGWLPKPQWRIGFAVARPSGWATDQLPLIGNRRSLWQSRMANGGAPGN